MPDSPTTPDDVIRVEMLDAKTGNKAGYLDVPAELYEAAVMLEAWMKNHGIKTMGGLALQ